MCSPVSWLLFIHLAALACQGFTFSESSLKKIEVNGRYKGSNSVGNPHENDSLEKRKTPDKSVRRGRREIEEQKANVTSTSLSGGRKVVNGSMNFNSLTPPVNVSIPILPLPPPKPNVSSALRCQSNMFSCRRRCQADRALGATVVKRQCFCDKSCELFQDCCADYDQYCPTSGTLLNSRQHELMTCVRGGHMTEAEGVWMISSCPTNWTQNDVKDRCSRYLDISYDNHRDVLPVVDRRNNTYKNHFCAQCHGLKLDEITFYDLNFSCLVAIPEDYNATQVLRFLFAYCSKLLWQPPTGFPRRYCYSFPTERHCSQVFPPEVAAKCFQGPVRVVYDLRSQRNFLNSFCAQCNGATRLQCGPGDALDDGDITPAMPFSIVMDASFANDDEPLSPKIRKLEISCGQGNVYDFHLQICRRGIKPFKMFPHQKLTYSVSALLQSNLSYSQPLIDPASFIQAFMKALKTREPLISQISTTEIRNHPGPVTTLVFNVVIDTNSTRQLPIQNFTRAMRNISIAVFNVKFTVVKVSMKPNMCVKVATLRPDEYTFQNNVVKIKDTGEIIQQQNFLSNATVWKDGTVIPVGFLFVCKQETQVNCTGVLVKLYEKEYTLLPNGSLFRNISEELYKPDAFQTVNGTIWICTNFSENYTRQDITTINNTKSNDMVHIILTNVGLSLSVICLVLVLWTFTIFRELRTLAGINLMNLCLALLLSHSLFLLASQVKDPVTCTVTAILLHYFFLVSFNWMSIIALDTWRAMSKIRVRRAEERFKTRFYVLRCIALGWLTGIGFVGICVALDQLEAISFHYGGVKGCWINNRKANLFFFVLPVALSVSFNAVFFVLTVKAIRRTSQQARQVTSQSQHRKDVAVFLKIFVLMGFTWLFGFLRFVSAYFDYPFIVFTSLQGVYIAIAFVFTARVRKMYCALFLQNHSNRASRKKNVSSPVVLSKFVKTRDK